MTPYRRFLRIALVLTMLISLVFVLPALSSAKADDVTLGKTTADKVNVRYGASTSARILFQIPNAGYIGTIKGETCAEKIHWYKVEFQHPDADNDRYYTGYINADFFSPLTSTETAAYQVSHNIATPTPLPSADPSAEA